MRIFPQAVSLHQIIRSRLSQPNYIYLRTFHASKPLFNGEDGSLVSKALKSLSIRSKAPYVGSVDSSTALPKKALSTKIKEGLQHYWDGSKLLAYETKISSKLLFKMLRGQKLIRREQRQLRRTISDLLRLVPFMVILIVPFLEFALPIILKLFPNILPSTFEDKASFVPNLLSMSSNVFV